MAVLKNLFAKAVELEKAHSRKATAILLFCLTHPQQVHDTAISIAKQVATLFAGV